MFAWKERKKATHTQRGKDKKNSNETPDFSKRQLQLTEKHSQFQLSNY